MSINIAILGSTNGTDAECILQSISKGNLSGINVKCIISNRSKSGILEKAQIYGISHHFISAKDAKDAKDAKYPKDPSESSRFLSREKYDELVDELLSRFEIDYIILIGWMRILSSNFVSKWKNRIINIHPSLLPAYEGEMDLNVHRAVLERGCKITGATLMFVDDGADTGPIIAQRAVVVSIDDTPESLKLKVQQVEQEMFLEYLPLLRDSKIQVENNKVMII